MRYFQIGFVVVVFIAILGGFVYEIIQFYDRKNNPAYTIGTTLDFKYSGGTKVLYFYYVNNVMYESYYNYSSNETVNVPNGKYIVLFSSKNPENSEMLLKFQVPDSIKETPINGWAEIPK